ncbi:MAG: tyrosine--tRNA ligase [Candidatus Aenigmarchaeota archaeon]|nr:tyrosine--tRNA ligase [Candidatus Aenigmarchaeota archaeon]
MDAMQRMDLVKLDPIEEIITEDELLELLKIKERPIVYDGFEPSGVAHLGTGVLRAIKIQDLLDANCRFKLLLADWHAMLNNKMGGDLERIQKAGKYLIEVWKACGVDTSKVEVVWASEMVKNPDYWKRVLEIAKLTTVSRMVRCSTIMGRSEGEMQYVSQLFYPAMQASDIFELEVDICQLGIDQRKVNILAREIAPKLGYNKPVCAHHHLLMGLQGAAKMNYGEGEEENKEIDAKMSKSKPETCIYVHDSPEDIAKKLKNAYCLTKVVEGNPVLELSRYIIFRKQKTLLIERPEKFGGNTEYSSYSELENAFREGLVHPMDLKTAVSRDLAKILEPVRVHFENNPEARELYEIVRGGITR